jgi:type 1 glutamine amidotransferase
MVVGVRGTRSPVTYAIPDIRVFSQQVYIQEDPRPDYLGGRLTVALDTQPTGEVTIPVASSDTSQGTTSVGSLTFTPSNWNVPQGVTVTEVDNVFLGPNAPFSIVRHAHEQRRQLQYVES